MKSAAYVVPSVVRNPRRTIAYVSGTIIAVGLISSVFFFVLASARVMTQRSIAPVRIDMQALVNNPRDSTTAIMANLLKRHSVLRAERFAEASFTSALFTSGHSAGQTSAGKLIAVDPSYFTALGVPVVRQGTLTPGGMVISVDMGTNLGARAGDTLTLRFGSRVPPITARISGIANMQGTDAMFAPLDPLLRVNLFTPPANVVIVDYAWFERQLKARLLRYAPHPQPGPIVRYNSPVSEQVHLLLRRTEFPSDPAQAKIFVGRIRAALELSQGGRITILDNISSALDLAQSDVLWAQAIFVFLALPGVVLAAALSRYITATTIESQRRELALLRIRGLGSRSVLLLLGSVLLVISVIGVALGIGAGWLSSQAAGRSALRNTGLGDPLVIRSLTLCILAGLVLGVSSAVVPLLGVARSSVMAVRRRVRRSQRPLWERLYLDLACLAVAILVYEVIQQNGGFQPVLNAEGNPTVSLSIFAFVSPLLFWLGGLLLLVRVSGFVVRHSGRLLATWLARSVIGELAARTIERRSGSLNQAMLLVAMAVAFSSGLTTFAQTYNQQQRVDAELTLGSDVKVTPTNSNFGAVVASRLRVPGVVAYTPFRSTLAYVGAEIQDIFGVDLTSFEAATRTANSFFVGNDAHATLSMLRATPNGILVSQETYRDYSLRMGDRLRIRLYNATKQAYVPVIFKLVGVAREFATAPLDAFLVTNFRFLSAATGRGKADLFLIKTSRSPGEVAAELGKAFNRGPAVTIVDLNGIRQRLSTSLTTLNLSALTNIDYGYTLVMLIMAIQVFGFATLLDRRKDFAVLQVMGTGWSRISALVLVEVAFAAFLGVVFGLAVGLGFAQMLTQILTAIFDPPPETIAIPWGSLGLISGLTALSAVLASAVVSIRLARVNLAEIVREA